MTISSGFLPAYLGFLELFQASCAFVTYTCIPKQDRFVTGPCKDDFLLCIVFLTGSFRFITSLRSTPGAACGCGVLVLFLCCIHGCYWENLAIRFVCSLTHGQLAYLQHLEVSHLLCKSPQINCWLSGAKKPPVTEAILIWKQELVSMASDLPWPPLVDGCCPERPCPEPPSLQPPLCCPCFLSLLWTHTHSLVT